MARIKLESNFRKRFINYMAKLYNVKYEIDDVKALTKGFTHCITQETIENDNCSFEGWYSFKKIIRKPRGSRNPKINIAIQLPERVGIKVTPTKKMRKLIKELN